ncbi:N-acetyl-D-Glu racemase DgcA [Mesorhizobium sp. YM1C-6-2]|uniref:N-acetyl-D-Glu racemase DgcA n=1 Tax=Mesorhizobium sp. YM1C-6-2 TaxID=1827501 RepID=UPI000EF1C399|nr:N-acetyl-D-Glu racemase DgcA [Mesorhizobium sp. YM1C-6-2]RLP22587.1 dipeptide epimerase [Mesorhizobium sp. YM1C-6-2]
MNRVLSVAEERFPIAGTFTISRGSKTEAEVVACTIAEGGNSGRGECVPYRRYGETVAGVRAEIEAAAAAVSGGITRRDLLKIMKPGAARNAVDCALWDLEAKLSGVRVAETLGIASPAPLETAFTLSLASPDAMAAQARENAARPLLKVKIGGDGDIARIRAVRDAAPKSRLILDANEGWTGDNIRENLAAAAELGVSLVEQPLPAGRDAILAQIDRPVRVCADESVHTAEGLETLVGLYDAVNIKLDKTGGLTAALELRDRARELGFGIMIGCMVGTSLAMAPAVLLAQGADFVDLDGPLLLARDREPGLIYRGSLVSPPEPALWG